MADPTNHSDIKSMSFEQALKELETIVDRLEKGDVELEETPLKNVAQEGRLAMYKHEGFWQCMDTYRDYILLTDLWKKGNPPWKLW